MKPFNREEFLSNIYNQDHRQQLLDQIDLMSESNPEIAKNLIEYRDILWTHHLDDTERQKDRILLGDKGYSQKVIECLRVMADSLEKNSGHIIISASLPELPIFRKFLTHIKVTAIAGPVGG